MLFRSFDRNALKIRSLAERESKSCIEKIAVDPLCLPPFKGDRAVLEKIAHAIGRARKNGRSVILTYGAHLIKNGMGPVLAEMVKKGYVTHLATNGAGSIHDWEFAFQGKTEEDVRKYIRQGQFGMWEETGKYINLAVLVGAASGLGYGESVGKMVAEEKLSFPPFEKAKERAFRWGESLDERAVGAMNLYRSMAMLKLPPGEMPIPHPYKAYSVQSAAFEAKIPLTIHPGFGYDIIYEHPFCSGAAIGIASETDFLRFVKSVGLLEGGVYLSVGSAIMSPMVLEKSISMARNVALQRGEEIRDFVLAVNDIQSGQWNWGSRSEPPKSDPAYYLRFCKSFDRMEPGEMHYICEDNRAFLGSLYRLLLENDVCPAG